MIMKDVKKGMLEHRSVLSVTLLVLTAGSVLFVLPTGTGSSWADTASSTQMLGMEEGEITAVGSTTLDVSGRMYRLHPNVTIKNNKNEPMELKQLRPGLVVQYRLKEGALYQLLVFLPR